MSQSAQMIDVVNQLDARFKTIDGSPDFSNNIPDTSIYKEHKDYDQVDSYPAIAISAVETVGSVQSDQVTYETPIQIEVFGYIQEEGRGDKLITTMQLAEDIEKAIYNDETLGGTIYGLSLDIASATMESYGVVKFLVKGTMCYTVD